MRNLIRQEIESIAPHDELEQRHRLFGLDWVDSGVELCRLQKPATPPIHLVSYFVVVTHAHLLLVDHKNAQLWLPTGGHVEPNEHPRVTVVREVFEELALRPVGEVGPPMMITCTETVGLSAGHTDVSLWCVVPVQPEQEIIFDTDEFNSIRWYGLDEIPFNNSDPHMRRFVSKLRSNNLQAQASESLSFQTRSYAPATQ